MTTRKRERESYSLESVSIALKLLDIVIHSDAGMNLTTLSNRARISKNKAFRMLNTLACNGVIEKDPAGNYVMGTASFDAARKIISKDSILTRIRPVMKKLSESVNEAVYFARRTDDQLILAEMVDCRQIIKAVSFVGRILAVTQPHALSTLNMAGRLPKGVTISFGGLDPDVTTISVEIANHCRQAIGSLVILAPSFRLTPVIIETEIIPALIEAARQMPLLEEDAIRTKPLSPGPPGGAKHDAVKAVGTNILVPARWGRSGKSMVS